MIFEYVGAKVFYGELRDFMRHGKGILYYEDGNIFEGMFVNGIQQGKGK